MGGSPFRRRGANAQRPSNETGGYLACRHPVKGVDYQFKAAPSLCWAWSKILFSHAMKFLFRLPWGLPSSCPAFLGFSFLPSAERARPVFESLGGLPLSAACSSSVSLCRTFRRENRHRWQVEVPFQGSGEDSHFGIRVRFLLLGKQNFPLPYRYPPSEDVGHVVVKNVQQETAIRLQLFVLHLCVPCPGLCPGLEVPWSACCSASFFDISLLQRSQSLSYRSADPLLLPRFLEVQFRVLAMDERPMIRYPSRLDGTLACPVIVRLVGCTPVWASRRLRRTALSRPCRYRL